MDSGDMGYFSAFIRMQTHENRHKFKPSHFVSVAGGVKKRLETNIQNKRRIRFTSFDNFRNLPENEPVQEPLNKVAQRELQLQLWKKEKEKRKAEALVNKKKPFVVGIPKTSQGFVPPPPVPSTSGRVTKSQTSKSKITNNGNKEKQKMYTFAPQNASFNPTLRNLVKPSLSTFKEEKCDQHEKETAMKAKQTNSDTTKTSEAGFFSVQSPEKSPAAATPPPRTTSLLQPAAAVRSNKAKKASAEKSSYAMLRASSIAKSVLSGDESSCEVNLVPATPINLGLTPGKSILKSNNNTSTKVASKISLKPFNMDTGSDSSPTSDDGQISGVEKLQENLVTMNTEEEKKENRRSSRKKKETLHNAEDNEVIMDIEGQDKENEPSSRNKRETNNNLMTMNTEECLEYKESRQSSRGRPKLVRQYAVDQVLPPALTKE